MRVFLSLTVLSLIALPGGARAGGGLRAATKAAATYIEQHPRLGQRAGASAAQRIGEHVVTGLTFHDGSPVGEGTQLWVYSPGRAAKKELPLDMDAIAGQVAKPGRGFVSRVFAVKDGRPVYDATLHAAGNHETRFEANKPSQISHEDWAATHRTGAAHGGTQITTSRRAANGRFAPTAPPELPASAGAASKEPTEQDRALLPELERLAKTHNVEAGAGLSAWAMAAVTKLKDPTKVAGAARVMLKDHAPFAGFLIPFAVFSVGSPTGVQPETVAAWKAVMAEHGLE